MRAKTKRKPPKRASRTKQSVRQEDTTIPMTLQIETPSVTETLTERQSTHGDFSENARVMQAMKRVLRTGSNWYGELLGARQLGLDAANLTDVQAEAIENIVVKLGRIVTGDPNHADNWRDIEGYARLARERLERLE